jgi:hypothetical protein
MVIRNNVQWMTTNCEAIYQVLEKRVSNCGQDFVQFVVIENGLHIMVKSPFFCFVFKIQEFNLCKKFFLFKNNTYLGYFCF